MNIKVLEIAGFYPTLEALRLPYGLNPRSICNASCEYKEDVNVYTSTELGYIDQKDITLLSTLAKRGDEHAKVLRGIIVWMKITAPIYWWCELETYRAGHERLASESTMHIDCKGLSGDELVDAKSKIPMGKDLTKVDFFSYQCLRNIYKQRSNHRLPEWKQFLDTIETLPLSKELITINLKDNNNVN